MFVAFGHLEEGEKARNKHDLIENKNRPATGLNAKERRYDAHKKPVPAENSDPSAHVAATALFRLLRLHI